MHIDKSVCYGGARQESAEAPQSGGPREAVGGIVRADSRERLLGDPGRRALREGWSDQGRVLPSLPEQRRARRGRGEQLVGGLHGPLSDSALPQAPRYLRSSPRLSRLPQGAPER